MPVAPKWLAVLSVAVLASCTSSGGSGPTTTYTVGGTVTGLSGSGLVLRNNGGGDLAISANGTFTFGTALASGATYAVTVASQPTAPAQICTVANGAGTVGTSNVTSVAVTCATVTRTVGGTVSGLAGSGLVLQNNAGDNLTVSANGAFTFGTELAAGATYAVTVLVQPTAPSQTCTVTNGTGTVGVANVTSVAVTCVTGSYTVGGTVAGLAGTVVLQNNAGDNLTVSANGAFTFATAVTSGASYAVTVLTQPGTQTCTVANGTGIVGGANVTNVSVVCASQTYTVGGTVSGLVGSGLILRNNGGNDLAVAGNGSFTFTSRVASGGAYAVTVLTQPSSPTQVCTVANGTGTVAGANVTGVTVTCVTSTFTVGGTVTGLATGATVVLRNNGANNLSVTANGPFTFATPVASGGAYAVTVFTQPTTPDQTCAVSAGTGTVGGANVTSVVVTCVTNGFTVGGTVTGLDGTGLVLRNNGGDSLTVSANGAFTFPTPVVSGGAYSVSIFTQPSSPAQVCTVTNATGTVASANVTSVTVTCPLIVVLQKWQAPVAWGGTANSFWPDADPDLVEHLVFGPALHETNPNLIWSAPDGVPVTTNALTGVGSAGVTRYSAGPFNVAPGSRYVATAGDAALDIQGDLLVCAVVKPDWNPVVIPTDDSVVIAKGERGVAGWALMQSSVFFSFRYQSSSGEKVAAIATDFAMPNANPEGPINPSYVVLCGGRDAAGGTLVMSANRRIASPVTAVPPTDTMVTSLEHASVGGYAVNDLNHDYGGRVYETAVWRLPATRANIEAKTAAILGLSMPDGSTSVTYVRDREGYYPGVGTPAPYHTAWKNQPRIDPTGKGFLFGLQANNRVQYPEALQLWTGTPGTGGAPVVTANDALPPGDADTANAARILLPAGASLSLPLGAFGNSGAVHGQIWVRAVGTQTGALTVSSDIASVLPPTPLGSQDIPLAGLATWTRIQLTQLTAAPPPVPPAAPVVGTVYLKNDGATPIEFWAWGVVLTQLGRDIAGVDAPVNPLGFDPGPTLYNSLLDSAGSREVLILPTLTPSTASTGFCIGAEAQPATGMTWQGPFFDRRTLVGWSNPAETQTVRLMVMGQAAGHVLEMLFEGTAAGYVKAEFSIPVDTAARIKGCVSPGGTMTLYVNDVAQTPIPGGVSALTAPPPDLAGGALSVGSDHTGTEPWQGYVKAAVACRLSGTIADCQ
jgi:hypothetical protein